MKNRSISPRSRRLVVLAMSVVVATGCTLGPDPARPVTAAEARDSWINLSSGQTETSEGAQITPWWWEFGDAVTVDLVSLALEHNSDVHAAAARVLESEALLRQAGASRWPQLDANLSGSRTKSSFVLPGIGRTSIYSTTYSDALGVSYQVDLFGKLKRTRQSAWASLLAEQAAQEAVHHAVVANVVRARVQVATAERALAIAQEIRDSWEQTLETVERRYNSGLVQAVDLYLARENLSATRANEVQLEAQVKLARHALDVLVGERPGTGDELPQTLPELPDLGAVPAGLPVELLDRRPDLRQSEAQLAAATYGVGAALADLYPSLNLTGSIGTTSDAIKDLASTDGLVYNAVASLVGPIFSGGTRRAEVAAARARVEAATAAYSGAVLAALREVEDALVNDSANQERFENTELRLQQARAADRLARERYQRGVEGLLTVLETERRLRSAEEALITTKADLWNTRIDLFLALGGDWSIPARTACPHSADNEQRPCSESPANADPAATRVTTIREVS